MYDIFVKYAEDHKLFDVAKKLKIDPEEDMPPYEDPSKVFPKRDL